MLKKGRKGISVLMALILLLNIIVIQPIVQETVYAANEGTVTITSLGNKGTVNIGSKTKSGTWLKMSLNSKKAFCMDLGKACHNGNTYQQQGEVRNWNQNTTGKNGFYAKIIRWFVVDKKRTDTAYTLSQALIWSVQENGTSETELKSIIRQVKNNTGYFSSRTVNQLYNDIFNPSGNWTATATIYEKKGGSTSYQRLLVVDAGEVPECRFVSDSMYYRQRITLNKKDENGNPLGNVSFTLSAHNLDDLYGFSINDINGYVNSGDSSEDTEFVSTGLTKIDTGRIIWRMSYWISTREYAYYTDSQLNNMTNAEKTAARQYLTNELDLKQGVDFGRNMTKSEAEILMNAEMAERIQAISNNYTLVENSTGNANIVRNSTYANGVNITLTANDSWIRENGAWPDNQEPVPADYYRAKQVNVTNNYKKVRLQVTKFDNYSSDRKAHGDATLDGAVFGVYEDPQCTNAATFYNIDGTSNKNNTFTTANGTFITGYLRCGQTYYIKELQAPNGYKLNTEITPITLDGSKYQQEQEYIPTVEPIAIGEEPILGKVEIKKTWSDPDKPGKFPEVGAQFQIYLWNKGSYEACSEHERAILTMDENGYAISKDLYCGRYTIHQLNTGGIDSIMVEDQDFILNENGKTYSFTKDDELFKAYLKIVKKDDNTGETVLKPNTKFKIYQVINNQEVLLTQETSDGTVNEFVTNENGEVTTPQSLAPGVYRIYEIDAVSGFNINNQYKEFEVNSKLNNYTNFADGSGETKALITVDFANKETYGKLKIFKTGEVLSDFENGNFIYKEQPLKGAKFEIYADGDIVTQDNQGTKWYSDGDLVATVTSGEGAEFTSECKDITGYSVNAEDGSVTVNLPLGKYKVKETKTPFGYILPTTEWSVEFNWANKDDEFVINSSEATDENGTLSVSNKRAIVQVTLEKTDALNGKKLSDVTFGVYTKNDIYNADGKKIAAADQKLGTVTTDSNGEADVKFDFPLMSEKYDSENNEQKLNSGDYYLKEESVSNSYFLDDIILPIHLEYKGDSVETIRTKIEHKNYQTEVEIWKTTETSGEELKDCILQITDENGEVIATWVTGINENVNATKVTNDASYQNLHGELTKDNHRLIKGLKHDTIYVLSETHPADGYTTAEPIVFKLTESESEPNKTVVLIKAEDGTFVPAKENIIQMVDKQTTVVFEKLTKEKALLGGAKIEVYDEAGTKVTEFTSKNDSREKFIGLFNVGETYTFKEVKAPKGYQIAAPVTYTVLDTAEEQVVSMTDKKYGSIFTSIPKDFFEGVVSTIPKLGDDSNVWGWIIVMIICAALMIFVWKKGRKNEENC